MIISYDQALESYTLLSNQIRAAIVWYAKNKIFFNNIIEGEYLFKESFFSVQNTDFEILGLAEENKEIRIVYKLKDEFQAETIDLISTEVELFDLIQILERVEKN